MLQILKDIGGVESVEATRLERYDGAVCCDAFYPGLRVSRCTRFG